MTEKHNNDDQALTEPDIQRISEGMDRDPRCICEPYAATPTDGCPVCAPSVLGGKPKPPRTFRMVVCEPVDAALIRMCESLIKDGWNLDVKEQTEVKCDARHYRTMITGEKYQ